MGINPDHWYLDDTTELWQVGIEGYGQPLEQIAQEADIPVQQPQFFRNPPRWVSRGVMNLNSRYGLIEMTYDTRLHVETVGHGILAFQMLLYLDHVMKLQSVPLSDEFKLALQDAHYPRKHDFVFDEGYRDLSSALAAFEAPLVNLATTIKKDRHAQEIKDKKLNAYVARQLAKYS